MFKKTVFALLAALVLTVSYGSAQAQTNPHGCVDRHHGGRCRECLSGVAAL